MIEKIKEALGMSEGACSYNMPELLNKSFVNVLFLIYIDEIGELHKGNMSAIIHAFRTRLDLSEEEFTDWRGYNIINKQKAKKNADNEN